MNKTSKKNAPTNNLPHFNNVVFDKISTLFELKQKGAISTEEFIQKKKNLLGLL